MMKEYLKRQVKRTGVTKQEALDDFYRRRYLRRLLVLEFLAATNRISAGRELMEIIKVQDKINADYGW